MLLNFGSMNNDGGIIVIDRDGVGRDGVGRGGGLQTYPLSFIGILSSLRSFSLCCIALLINDQSIQHNIKKRRGKKVGKEKKIPQQYIIMQGELTVEHIASYLSVFLLSIEWWTFANFPWFSKSSRLRQQFRWKNIVEEGLNLNMNLSGKYLQTHYW